MISPWRVVSFPIADEALVFEVVCAIVTATVVGVLVVNAVVVVVGVVVVVKAGAVVVVVGVVVVDKVDDVVGVLVVVGVERDAASRITVKASNPLISRAHVVRLTVRMRGMAPCAFRQGARLRTRT